MKRSNNKAFTILELLVVVAIIAVLSAIAIPNFIGRIEEAKESQNLAEINAVTTAVATFYADKGYYPTLQRDSGIVLVDGCPQNVKFEELVPNYLASLPHFSYWWVDVAGKVYHTQESIGKLTGNVFTPTEGYTYKLNGTTELLSSYTLQAGDYITAVDDKGLELPKITTSYKNALAHPESPEYEAAPEPVVFSGLGAAAFDGNATTNLRLSSASYATWSGDLTGRVVSMDINSPNSYDTTVVKLVDANNTPLAFTDDTTGNTVTQLQISGARKTLKVVVPANAAKIQFTIIVGSNGDSYLYSLQANSDLTLPKPVSNVSSTSTTDKVTLSWTNGAGGVASAIYRDGVYVGSTTGTTYVDTPLYSASTHVYSIESKAQNGNRGPKVSHTAQTLTPAIVWRGLTPAVYDTDVTTNLRLTSPSYSTWTGDLTGKVVSLDISTPSGYDTAIVKILDENNTPLSFTNAATGSTVTQLTVSGTRTTLRAIMPANAAKIQYTITVGVNGYVYAYTVKVE